MFDITGIVAVISLVVSLWTFYTSHVNDKQKLTIDVYIQLQDFLHFLADYNEDEIEDFVSDKNSEEYKTLCICLARIELLAIGIDKKVYDLKTLYNMSHGYLDGLLRDNIEYLISTKKNGEAYYSNTIKLLSSMDHLSRKR